MFVTVLVARSMTSTVSKEYPVAYALLPSGAITISIIVLLVVTIFVTVLFAKFISLTVLPFPLAV